MKWLQLTGWLTTESSLGLFRMKILICYLFISQGLVVVYFDEPTGAAHAVCWSKPFVSGLKQVFSSFSNTNVKKERKLKITRKKNTKKHA